MRWLRKFSFLFALLLLLAISGSAMAQTYLFSLDKLTADYYLNEDGTASIDYTFLFCNDPSASPIDYVDVGMPNSSFSDGNMSAFINDKPVFDISRSGFQGSGTGVAIGLGPDSIPPGKCGTVRLSAPSISNVLYPDSDDDSYASARFSPTWFGSQYMTGNTDMTVTFHLPPGVTPEEPRWHKAPDGFPSEPQAGFDEQRRIYYSWNNPQAAGYQMNEFGASFPAQYVPESAIVRQSFWAALGITLEGLFNFLCCAGFASLFVLIPGLAIYKARNRRLQYLPPKIAIEGHGIKRGLTAVEAAILMEQPLDKVLTMILFGALKKGAATVAQKDPLELELADPLPESLRPYESNFLKAFEIKDKPKRQKSLQEMMIDLVKSLSAKMKGFSRKESVAYYRDITKRAWAQVEAADTPEVRSEKYDQYMEWTMLDKDYDDRTQDVFRTGPVFVPTWWGRYDPDFRRTVSTPTARPISAPSGGLGGKVSLPTLPGATFAAGVVNGVQNMSAGAIGNLTSFTSGITNKTNPVPVSTGSSGGSRSGGGCACACACAGCACACAGGGR